MITPVLLYASTGQPMGAQGYVAAKIQLYRPTYVLDAAGLDYVAQVMPFGTVGTLVGTPIIVTKAGISFKATVSRTTGRYSESRRDPTVMRGEPELNLSTFVTGVGQATFRPGDYFEIIMGWLPTSTPAAPALAAASRWFIGDNTLATSGFNEWNMKFEFDAVNSDPAFNLF
jgi:hypothetical protein